MVSNPWSFCSQAGFHYSSTYFKNHTPFVRKTCMRMYNHGFRHYNWEMSRWVFDLLAFHAFYGKIGSHSSDSLAKDYARMNSKICDLTFRKYTRIAYMVTTHKKIAQRYPAWGVSLSKTCWKRLPIRELSCAKPEDLLLLSMCRYNCWNSKCICVMNSIWLRQSSLIVQLARILMCLLAASVHRSSVPKSGSGLVLVSTVSKYWYRCRDFWIFNAVL